MSAFWNKRRVCCCIIAFVASVALFFVYINVYVKVLGCELPKTKILKEKNAVLKARAGVLDNQVREKEMILDALALRDEEIYRSIFGLNSISASVRESGFGQTEKYSGLDRNGRVGNLCLSSDNMLKKAYVQSISFDEIELMLATADNMATSVPAICPVAPDDGKVKISSPFGYRVHPVLKYSKFHSGIDFGVKSGNPVYATGDGVVESIDVNMRGYGRQVVINHGFGYKTRYAHLKTIIVTEGMKVRRGEQIAVSGNSGLTSGPHLHYEVMFKGKAVNPYHYFDVNIPTEQYMDMVSVAGEAALPLYVHPAHRKALNIE